MYIDCLGPLMYTNGTNLKFEIFAVKSLFDALAQILWRTLGSAVRRSYAGWLQKWIGDFLSIESSLSRAIILATLAIFNRQRSRRGSVASVWKVTGDGLELKSIPSVILLSEKRNIAVYRFLKHCLRYFHIIASTNALATVSTTIQRVSSVSVFKYFSIYSNWKVSLKIVQFFSIL